MSRIGRYFIGRVGISAVDMDQTLIALDKHVRAGAGAYVCVANVRTVVLSQKDGDFCSIQNQSLLTIPDGMPLVWAARVAGLRQVQRVTGPDLMLKILSLSVDRGYSHYFYGDTEQTLGEMQRAIVGRFPGVDIRGWVSPPFGPSTDGQMQQAVETINKVRPTFVWVALGAPKQERWMAKIANQLDHSILMGVGAAFRFVIGQYKHPPAIIQKLGLEGLCWRFLQNPGREAWWYCKHVPAYGTLLAKVLAARLRGRTSWHPVQ